MTSGDPGIALPESLYTEWSHKLPTKWGPLVISQPEAIEQVLFDQKRFGRGRQVNRLIRRAWRNGLAGATGDSWKTQRRAVGPAFRVGTVYQHAETMAQITRRAAKRWQDRSQIDVQTEAGEIVSEIVMNTLITGAGDTDRETLAGDTLAFMRGVTKFGLIDSAPLPDGLVNWMRGVFRTPEAKRLRSFSDRLAALREQSESEGSDVVSLLRDKGPLEDNILGMITASFETSARGAAWALYVLACQPDLQEQVREEVIKADKFSGAERIEALNLTRCVVKEVLRMYPPAPNTVRAALQRTELLGHSVPKGLPILIDIHAVHHHQKIWEDPFVFDPHRFAEPTSLRHRAAYIPFSAGPRMCVAAHFAELEIMMIASEIVRAFQLKPVGAAPQLSFLISVHSTNGLNLSLEPV